VWLRASGAVARKPCGPELLGGADLVDLSRRSDHSAQDVGT